MNGRARFGHEGALDVGNATEGCHEGSEGTGHRPGRVAAGHSLEMEERLRGPRWTGLESGVLGKFNLRDGILLD